MIRVASIVVVTISRYVLRVSYTRNNTVLTFRPDALGNERDDPGEGERLKSGTHTRFRSRSTRRHNDPFAATHVLLAADCDRSSARTKLDYCANAQYSRVPQVNRTAYYANS